MINLNLFVSLPEFIYPAKVLSRGILIQNR